LGTSEPPSDNAYADWVKSKNETYRTAAVEKLRAKTSESQISHVRTMEDLKATNWRLAVDIVAQSKLDSCLLESHLPAVERIPAMGLGKHDRFVPVRFAFMNKLDKDEKLTMGFDVLLLSKTLGREVSLGKIIHGDETVAVTVKTSAVAGEVRKCVEKIVGLLSNSAPPDLVLNRHCAECEFQARCRKIAVEKDDLSLLAGMGEKERQKLRSKGIFTVTQLSYTFRPRRRPKRLRDKRERYHHSLKALAIREKKIHIVGNPELKIAGTPVYLDVEGLPDHDLYYLIGLRIGNRESAVQHSLWADTVEDEGKIWREFLAILETVEKPVLIHYGSYETTFLKRMGESYGEPMGGSDVAKAIESAINVVSVLYAQIYFPTFANGLKDIAACLGFKWSEAEPSGLKTIIWRNAWEESKSPHLRGMLINYNVEDCQALEILVRATAKLGTSQTPDTSLESGASQVVHAESLPRETMFGRFATPISEFEQINKAARWITSATECMRVRADASRPKPFRGGAWRRLTKSWYVPTKRCAPDAALKGIGISRSQPRFCMTSPLDETVSRDGSSNIAFVITGAGAAERAMECPARFGPRRNLDGILSLTSFTR
jgi:predicted RecB family nuclease